MANFNKPKKQHPAQELHFKTSGDSATAGAPPVADEPGQADASNSVKESDASAAPITQNEAVVENPTPPSIYSGGEQLTSAEPEILLPDARKQESVSDHLSAILIDESPIEKKIHELIETAKQETVTGDLGNWKTVDSAPKNGLPVRLTDILAGDGTLAFWKRTRAFNGKSWGETGKWMDYQTGQDLRFTPKYWQERFSVSQ